MTSQGSAYGRFRKAVDRGTGLAALAAARELPTLSLIDALDLCLALRDDPARYERAIVRWTARYVAERPGRGVAEAQALLALLASLQGGRARESAQTFARFLNHTEDAPLVKLLLRRLECYTGLDK